MLQLLENIYQGKNLSFEQTVSSFEEVLTGKVELPLIAAILAAMKTKGETIDEIAGAAQALRKQAQPFPTTEYVTTDCCGTGGDGFSSINVSTLSALVSASLGVKVVKHGNRSVSSQCGSSDLMQALGINIHLTPEKSKALLDKTNFCFLFAPDYHQGVKHVMPVRRSLKTRTIFNLIGPLANPAQPEIQLLGVYDAGYAEPFAKILRKLGTKKALIVNGSGLDEIAVHDATHAVLLDQGQISSMTITPESLGIKSHVIADLVVNGQEESLSAALEVLAGTADEAKIDMVAVNSAAVLFLNDKVSSLAEGVSLVKDTLRSGKVLQHMNLIKEASNV